jgi:RNA recognition motif-containing protein
MSGINIYVGNLSFDTSEDQLRELFEGYGKVDSAKVISDHFSGKSRGFGFVEMAEKEDGIKAISALDSKEFMGRSLRVNEARPRREGGGRRDDRGGGESRW